MSVSANPLQPSLLEQFQASSPISGGNAAFLEDLYERYLAEPAQAPADWRRYFDALKLYESAAKLPGGDQLRAYNGIYLTQWKLNRKDAAAEAFGRVVFEAMAAGVPVACASRGGYAGYLEHGRSALLATSTDELMTSLLALRDDPPMAAGIARAARRAFEAVQRDARRQLIRLLVGEPSPGDAAALERFAMTQPLAPGD